MLISIAISKVQKNPPKIHVEYMVLNLTLPEMMETWSSLAKKSFLRTNLWKIHAVCERVCKNERI